MWGVLFEGIRRRWAALQVTCLFLSSFILFLLISGLFCFVLFYFILFILFMMYFLVASCARVSRDNGSHRPGMSHRGVGLVQTRMRLEGCRLPGCDARCSCTCTYTTCMYARRMGWSVTGEALPTSVHSPRRLADKVVMAAGGFSPFGVST